VVSNSHCDSKLLWPKRRICKLLLQQ
jgi:hypothetical protein